MRRLPLLLLIPLAAFAAGCHGAGESAYVLCCMAPRYRSEHPPRPPDTRTAHCDALVGTEYTAENGDRLVFDATQARWTHDGKTEARTWRCETDRRVVLAGFAKAWQGTLTFEEDGRLSFGQQTFRPEGSDHLFPCESVAGRTYFAETGDSLAFVDERTVRWTTGAGTRTVSWRCQPQRITLHDGTEEYAIVLRNEETLSWKDLDWIYAPDGNRPRFPCDDVPGSRWRAPNGETLAFNATEATWTTAAGHVIPPLRWSCRGTSVWLEPNEELRQRTRFTLGGGRLHPVGGVSFERVE